jgi:hypothetical protein
MAIYENHIAVSGVRGYLSQFVQEFNARRSVEGFFNCFRPLPQELMPISAGNLPKVLQQNADSEAWRKRNWGVVRDILVKNSEMPDESAKPYHETIFRINALTDGGYPLALMRHLAEDYTWLSFEIAAVSEEADTQHHRIWRSGKLRTTKDEPYATGIENINHRFSTYFI